MHTLQRASAPLALLLVLTLSLAPASRAWADPIDPVRDADPSAAAAVTVLSGDGAVPVSSGGSAVRTVGIVFTAVGGVTLLAGFGTTLATLVTWSEMDSTTSLECRRDFADTVDVLAPVSDGLLLGGAVLLLAGILMMEIGAPSGFAAAPAVGPDQLGMNMSLTW